MTNADEALFARFVPEFEALQNKPPIEISLDQMSAWMILSIIQLALRHPEARQTAPAATAEVFARSLQARIAPPGSILAEVAERGWAE